MKHQCILAACLFLSGIGTTASALEIKARQKYLENYNVQRALEMMEENPREAFSYLNRETDEHGENGYAWYLMAKMLSNVGNYGTALTYSTHAISTLTGSLFDPEWASMAYLLRAEVYEEIGKDEERLKDLNDAVKCDKIIGGSFDNSDAYSSRAQYYYEKKQYDKADADYLKMLKADPNNAMALAGVGRDAFARGDYETAATYYQRIPEADAEYPYYHNFLANALLHLGRYGEACDEIIASLREPSTRFVPDRDLVVDSIAPVAADTLIARLDKALLNPGNEETTFNFIAAMALNSVNRNGEALTYILRAAEAEGTDGSLYAHCSRIARVAGKDSLSLVYALEAYKRDSSDVDHYLTVAASLNALGRQEEAAEWCLRAIEEVPDENAAYMRLTWSYLYQKRYQEASESNELALLISPDAEYSLYQRGLLLFALRREEELRKHVDEALTKISIHDEDCTRALLFAMAGRGDEALAEIDTCLQEKPHHKDVILAKKAEVYLFLGQEDQCRQTLEEAKKAGYPRMHILKRRTPFCDHLGLFTNL